MSKLVIFQPSCGLTRESASADFYDLRQDFSPPNGIVHYPSKANYPKVSGG